MNLYLNAHEQMPTSEWWELTAWSPRLLVVATGVLLYHGALQQGFLSNSQCLASLSLLLMLYLSFEMWNHWRRESRHFWINPAILGSVTIFGLPFGISNILYFLPEAAIGKQPSVTPWMDQLMLLVLLGAVAMWTGYHSTIAQRLGIALQQSDYVQRWLSPSIEFNTPIIFLFVGVGLVGRLSAISLGVYGYSSTYERLIGGANYTQYLAMAQSLGTLALVALALQHFSNESRFGLRGLVLWVVVGYEVAFGFLSGFKSAVAMPFIIVGLVHYAARQRFPRWLVPAVAIALISAYAIIEPFRNARNAESEVVRTDVGSLVALMVTADDMNLSPDEERKSDLVSFIERNSMTHVSSIGLEFVADKNLPEGSPDFLGDILYSPIYAVVPRFLLESKPLANAGLWYNNHIVGDDNFSSTAFSPFVYLYFGGGLLAVFIGFVVVGVIHRGIFDGMRFYGSGGIIVSIGMLNILVNLDSAFNTFVQAVIRFFPLLLITQYALIRRPR